MTLVKFVIKLVNIRDFMLDVNFIRQNPDQVKEGVAAKNADPKIVDKFLNLDNLWRAKVAAVDNLRSEQNDVSAQLKKGRSADLISRAQILKKQLAGLEKDLVGLEEKRRQAWTLLPNLPFPEAPRGRSDKENVVLREAGKKRKFAFKTGDYLNIAEKLGIIDVRRAAKVSGSRFGYFAGGAAILEFGLIHLIVGLLTDKKFIAGIIRENKLDLSDAPFIPVIPPVLINHDAMWSMGYLDRGADDIYRIEKDNLYLVGTSEQSIGPMHKDEIFKESDLPRRYLGFSTCFRREAGSYGKDTKGILRVHQFDKLEMFSFTVPETSKDEHRLLLVIEEKLMSELQIPYRVVDICSGDLGDAAAAKFDIEAWLPGQKDGEGEYRETHSSSNTTDFQSRRLNIRYLPEKAGESGKVQPQLVHMLNGTAMAVGRGIIAIIENYQTAGGNVAVPKILQKITGMKEIKA